MEVIPRVPSPADFLRFRREHRELITRLAAKRLCAALDAAGEDDLDDKFLRGRREYGGDFDPQAIACLPELQQEAFDVLNYEGLHLYQQYLDDPTVLQSLSLLLRD